MQDKQCMDVATCPVSASHETTACVPVSISPFADCGPICIECCGGPVIHSGGEPCCGTVCGRYEFTISQKMKINIPIAFGADVLIGETYVHNGQTTGSVDGDCCICDCSEFESNVVEIPKESMF
ncbi:MAG: hypothetical protein HFE49_08985 [Clostridia bacterium]|nr:hypothetical protein [Clostridia bacterium]